MNDKARYVVGWMLRSEWHDGDGEVNFERRNFSDVGVAWRHAEQLAKVNPLFTFIVYDDDDDGSNPIIVTVNEPLAIPMSDSGAA